jgi:alpha-tubulin suppressor-like RCC1 family protein
MRKFFPQTTLAIGALMLGASLASAGESGSAPYNLILEGRLPEATLLSVGIDQFDAKEAAPMEFTMVGGKVQNSLSIPAAKGRRVVLRAENADGKVLYEGALEIDVGDDFTPQVSVEMKSALDGSPGELTLASHRVAVDFAAVEREGKRYTRVTADVFDANGQRLEVKGDELAWEIDDPWLRETLRPCPEGSGHAVCAEFEPRKPDGNKLALNACYRGGICRIEFVPPIVRAWSMITVGLRHHACALKLDGSAYCWGQGQDGQLGIAAPKDCANRTGPQAPGNGVWGCSGTPVLVVCPNGPCNFIDISAGFTHTCAVDAGGDAWCWGSNEFGELGIGGTTAKGFDTPLRVATQEKFQKIRAGAGKTCGLTRSGQVFCWGINDLAIVPANTDASRVVLAPERVDLPTRAAATAIDLTANHACALVSSGSLYCWGSNADFKLGSSQFTPALRCHNCPAEPRLMQDAGISELTMKHVSLVSAGANSTCAQLTTAETVCWGRGLPQFGMQAPLERLSVGERHYCAIGGGALRCAGNGALGDGLTTIDPFSPGRGPVAMAGKYRNYRDVDAGFDATCAIGYDEQIYCWGANNFGGLGLGLTAQDVNEPTPLYFLQLQRLPPPYRYP